MKGRSRLVQYVALRLSEETTGIPIAETLNAKKHTTHKGLKNPAEIKNCLQPKKRAKNRHPSVPSKIYVYEIQPRQGLFPALSLGLESFEAHVSVRVEMYLVARLRAVGLLGNHPDAAFKGAVGSVEMLALREPGF